VNIAEAVGFAMLEIPRGVNVSKAVGYTVLNQADIPVWQGFTLSDGYVGIAYNHTWDISPPTSAPVTFSVVSGSLPTGLSLRAYGATGGQLTGTPTVAGSSTFTLQATNPIWISGQEFHNGNLRSAGAVGRSGL
jgi:large repetitive protein